MYVRSIYRTDRSIVRAVPYIPSTGCCRKMHNFPEVKNEELEFKTTDISLGYSSQKQLWLD